MARRTPVFSFNITRSSLMSVWSPMRFVTAFRRIQEMLKWLKNFSFLASQPNGAVPYDPTSGHARSMYMPCCCVVDRIYHVSYYLVVAVARIAQCAS